MEERKTISLNLATSTIEFLDSLKTRFGIGTRSAAFEAFIKETRAEKEVAYTKEDVKSMILDILAEMNFEQSKTIEETQVDKVKIEDDAIAKSMKNIFGAMED